MSQRPFAQRPRDEWILGGPVERSIQIHLDSLLEQAHPGGEYALARRGLEQYGPRADLLETLRRLEAEHGPELLGLADGITPVIRFRGGVWNAVELHGGAPDRLSLLLDSPMGRLVEEVTLAETEDEAATIDLSSHLAHLLEGGPRPFVRFLSVIMGDRCRGSRGRSLKVRGRFSDAAPNLEHLEISADEVALGASVLCELDRLRSLFFRGNLDPCVIDAMTTARFPALETLRFDLPKSSSNGPLLDRFVRLLDGRVAPRLRSVWLSGFGFPNFGRQVVEALLGSPVLANLRLVHLPEANASTAALLRERARSLGNTVLTTIGLSEEQSVSIGTTLFDAYHASSITVLEGLLPVRIRPGMYIGDVTEAGLRWLLCDIVRELTFEPETTSVALELGPAGGLIGVSARSPGELRQVGQRVRKGVARFVSRHAQLAVLNAVCERFTFELLEEEKAVQTFRHGIAVDPETTAPRAGPNRVTLEFALDPAILPRRDVDLAAVASELRHLSYLVPGVSINLHDLETAQRIEFNSSGLPDLLQALGRGRAALHPPVLGRGARDGTRVEVALQWSRSAAPGTFLSYVNARPTRTGGTHLNGALLGLVQAIEAAGTPIGQAPPLESRLSARFPGLVMVAHAQLASPNFNQPRWPPDRSELLNPEAAELAAEVTRDAVTRFIAQDPTFAERLWSTPG